jgi:chromosome partitioning protein
MQVFTVAAAKGGVAKTTTAASLAIDLAQRGPTLLVDFDRQGSAAVLTGNDPAPDVARFLMFGEMLSNLTIQDKRRPNLYLWRGNSTTLVASDHARSNGWTARALLEAIADHPTGFTYVVIDTPPSGYLQEIGIQAAHHLVIPVALDVLSVKGMADTIKIAEQFNQQCWTILPVFADATIESRHYLELIERKHPDRIAQPVPRRVAVREACAEGQSINEYDPANDAAAAYRHLVTRLTGADHATETK